VSRNVEHVAERNLLALARGLVDALDEILEIGRVFVVALRIHGERICKRHATRCGQTSPYQSDGVCKRLRSARVWQSMQSTA
jgi:hypothetical protein